MHFIMIIIVIGLLFCYYTFIFSPRQMKIKTYTISSLEIPLNIAFLSDIHFTTYNFAYRSHNILKTLEQIQPDIIIFGGDLIDKQWEDTEFLILLQGFLKQLQAPFGSFAVCGNHDALYISHQTYQQFMKTCGIHVLNNERYPIQGYDIQIGGVEDALFGKPNLNMFPSRYADLQILVTHEPDIVDQMNIKHVDLIFAGHTHGGQIRIPFLYKMVLPILGRRYIKGLYWLNNTCLLVSSGIGGALFSGRFANPPQIMSIQKEIENE